MTSINVDALDQFGRSAQDAYLSFRPVAGAVAADQTVCSIEDGLPPHEEYVSAFELANSEATDLLLKLHFLNKTATQLAATVREGSDYVAAALDSD